MNALVPNLSIEHICLYRDKAIAQFATAFEKLAEANAEVAEAHMLWSRAVPNHRGGLYDRAKEVADFQGAISLPGRDAYLRTAKRLIDVSCWEHIITNFGIEQLMDKEAKDKLRAQMRYVPERTDRAGQIINQDEIDKMLPEVTVENVYATLEGFQRDAEMIFRRGIVNVFSKLDRRFRSHDGFKVGNRMILNYFVDREWGSFSSYGDKPEMLTDIERTFLILDKITDRAVYGGIVATIERERRGGHKPRQSEHTGDYFKVRIFKNGNAHLWFTRPDLVEKVNKILAEHYGEVVGDSRSREEDPLKPRVRVPAKHYGFYPTPGGAADSVFSKASILQEASKPRLKILEPSAGTGNLARRCIQSVDVLDGWSGGRERYADKYRFDNAVDCIEIQPHMARKLQEEGIYRRVICADFLQIQPDPSDLYDRVIMNPPFDRERDIDHVMHAMSFLKEDGQLVAIMSAGTEFRETKKSVAFRKLMSDLGAKWEDLPAGSFAESGTYCNTGILTVWKNGTKDRWSRPTWPELG